MFFENKSNALYRAFMLAAKVHPTASCITDEVSSLTYEQFALQIQKNIKLIESIKATKARREEIAKTQLPVDSLSPSVSSLSIRSPAQPHFFEEEENTKSCALIYLSKSADLIAWQLAFNALDIAFLTLEYGSEARLNQAIEQCRPQFVVEENGKETIATLASNSNLTSTAKPEDFVSVSLSTSIELTAPGQAIASRHLRVYETYSTYPEDCDYIVFSSGSTGKPKQIWLSSAPIIEVCRAQAMALGIRSESTQVSQKLYQAQPSAVLKNQQENQASLKTPSSQNLQNTQSVGLWLLNPAFDASLSDIYTILLQGAHLVVSNRKPSEMKALRQLIETHQVSHCDVPPVVFSLWLSYIKKYPASFQSLKAIIFGGEKANPEVVAQLRDYVRLFNAYGPTETTICSSLKEVGDSWRSSDIGLPLPGVRYKVVDGELHIGGEHVALGYNLATLNHKFYEDSEAVRWFISGDAVVYDNEAHTYLYKGRLDRQFKHNGQLIYPEEIETAATLCGASVASVDYVDHKIKLYYAGDFQKEKLVEHIPTFMLPQLYERIENVEQNLNQNWKLKIKK